MAYASLPEVIALIRPGVVAVGTDQKTRRSPAKFLGTGFAVGDGSLGVTNTHVIPEVLAVENMERLAVFVGRGQSPEIRLAENCQLGSSS